MKMLFLTRFFFQNLVLVGIVDTAVAVCLPADRVVYTGRMVFVLLAPALASIGTLQDLRRFRAWPEGKP
jgi:hypothetical protein